MNDPRHPCDSRSQDLSLLAAGCLPEREEGELRAHLAGCAACRGRYEQLASVCSGLRTARPAVERGLDERLSGVKEPARTHLSIAWRVAMLAAAVVVLAGVLSQFAFHRTEDPPTRPVEVVELPNHAGDGGGRATHPPNLLALRRAASESDDAFDRLLARYSDPRLLEPLNHPAVSKEPLP